MKVSQTLLVLVLLLVALGCTAEPASPIAPPIPGQPSVEPENEAGEIIGEAPEEFFITVNATLAGKKLTIDGDTNLPDKSSVTLSIWRLFRCEGETKWQQVVMTKPKEAMVMHGKYQAVIGMPSEEWYDYLSDSFREKGTPPIAEVSDDLEIIAGFSPKVPQQDTVYEIVGRDGEKLKGEQVRPVKTASGGTYYILEVTQRLHFPFTLP